ncbi:hypothetical protein E2C01_089405 [Portunus trituberculatus]|uniref:Uncharacterized protein n=1 Tax=Portunus trituberculatus TaxID=210409 RepID=A0A5B7JIQ4_PORTR|nr:hypothetical protein [Portunus trituberculatus]
MRGGSRNPTSLHCRVCRTEVFEQRGLDYFGSCFLAPSAICHSPVVSAAALFCLLASHATYDFALLGRSSFVDCDLPHCGCCYALG